MTTSNQQITKAVIKSTRSFALDSLDARKHYDASLIGNSLSGTAHTVLKSINSKLTGDSLTAVGDFVTLTGGAGRDSLKALGANNVLIAGAGAQTLVASKNGTTFQFATTTQIANDSIIGGAGIDTLVLTKAAGTLLGDSLYGSISGTEILSLTGANSVTLGATAQTAGINRIIGGAVASAYLQDDAFTRSLTLTGGAGKDTFSVANRTQLAANSLVGGGGADTLMVRAGGVISDTDFSKVSAIGTLSLGAAASVTLGAAASLAGLNNVVAGDGAVRLVQASGNDSALTLRGGAGDDTFVVATGSQLGSDVVAGGAGANALLIASAGSIDDTSFARVTGVQALSLTSASDVTLGSNAAKAGIVSVFGGAASDTFTHDAKSSAKIAVIGGASDDFIGIGSVKQLASDTVIGSDGTDTLAVLSAGAIVDAAFANITGVEVLSLTGDSSVTLDGSAGAAGFSTIYGGDGLTKINHTTGDARALTIVGGSGTNLVTVADGQVLANDSIVAGSGGIGTLAVASEATLDDGSFDKVQNIGVLSLTGASGVTLGSAAVAAQITTVIGGSGDSTFVQNAASAIQITAGRGNDLIALADAGYLADNTLIGGTGINTLALSGAAEISDDAFTNHKGLQVLALDEDSSVTLEAAAQKAGVVSVIGGSGNLTVTQTADNSSSLTLVGGSGDGSFSIATAAQLGKDSIVGGAGSNTLSITSDATLADKSFAKVSGVQALSLTGSSTVILGAASSAAEFATIFGGDGNTEITQTTENTNALTIDGGSGISSITLAKGDYLAANSIVGGSGDIATIVVASGATLEDDAFAQIQNVGILKLTGSSDLALDAQAAAAGISTVYGGAGASNYSLLSGISTLIAGKGNDFVTVQDADLLADDSIVGGGGKDTLQILNEGEISDESFTNVQGISVLSLNGATAVTLDAAAFAAGIAVVAAGDDSASLTQGAGHEGSLQLLGGSGDDLITVDNVDLLAKDIVTGNDGVDTLVIANEGAVLNTTLAKVRGVEVIQLTGSSSAVLASNAFKNNLQTIIGGEGDTTITQAVAANLPLYIDGSATSSIIVGVANQGLLTEDTVVGGEGEDTLIVTSAGQVADDAFGNVSGMEVLSLTGASAVTLGDNASGAAGILTVLGGTGNSTFTQTAGALNIAAGKGNDLFRIDSSELLAADTIAGGDGINTLRISTESEIADEAFTNVTGIQNLFLNDASALTLGGAASAAGITLVAAGTGDSTITQTADDSNATRILGGDGNDLFALENADLLASDTISGGKGVNTLSIAGDVELDDTAFANLKQIGVLTIEGATTATLGSAARNAGISTILGGDGDSSYVQTTGVLSLTAGAGNDLVSVLSNKMLATDTIAGGDGDNTLQVAASTKIVDADFANTTGFGVLSLTGASAVVLGEAAGTAGITSVFGGEGASTFDQTDANASALYLDGTANADGGNLFIVSSVDQAAGNTFAGAGADKADTLQINGDSAVEDGILANIQGIAALKLDGASSANLDVVGAAGILTLFGGAGAGTYTAEAGAEGLLLKAGAAGDLITVADAAILAGQTLDGGIGNDTLVINQEEIEVADETFTNLVSINSVSIAGAAQITLGSAALAAGVTAISLGDGNSSFTQLEDNTLALSLTSGAGDDLYSINDGKQLTKNFLISGDGSDTLQIVTESNKIADQNFTRISGFEVLSLAANNSVELGVKATDGLVAEAGATVIAGLGGTTLNAAKYGNALVVDASTDEAGNNSIALGETASTILMGNGDAFASSTIRGGADVDTLALTGADGYTLEDEAFANKSGLDVLQIQDPFTEKDGYAPNEGDNVITLGVNAFKSGITTLVGGLGNTTLSQVQGNSTALYFDGSAAATNFVSVDVPLIANNDTFVGGEGEDTLAIGYANDDANPVNEITDDAFANKTSFETLVLTGSSAVTLGDNAAGDIGLLNVVLGDGDSEVLQTAGSFTIDAGTAASALVTVDSVELLAANTIIGGEGVDTVALNNEGEITDDIFANITAVEVLSAVGSSNVVLGDNAGANGLTTVILGDGDSTLSQTAGAVAIDASNSASAFVSVDSIDLLLADTILGGEGVDTLIIANEGDVSDDAFANVSAVDVLVTSGSSNVTLDANAGANGLSTLILGDGDSTVVQTAGSFLIDAAASNSVNINVGTSAILSADTITGSDGIDTLSIAEEGSITDDQFSVVTAVEVLQVAGASSVELGENAAANGLNTVILGDGDAIVYQTAGSFLIDGSTTSSISAVIDTIDLLIADTITGGEGEADSITISNEGEITDEAFTNITGVEVLQASGSSSINLADIAAGNGLTTVVLGEGNSTLTQTAGAFTIDGSNGSSALLSIDNAELAAADTILGTSGTDTLLLVNEGDVSDELFANKTGIEILQVSGASNVTLGENAANSDLALQSIILGDGDGTVTQSAGAFLIDGAATSSVIVTIDTAELAAGDTIIGGEGSDTLSIAGEGEIADAVFANVTGVEIFQAAGSSSIELGDNAASNGLTTVILGDGDSTLTQSAGAFLIDAAAAGSAVIAIASIELVAGNTITGSEGTDTLALAAQGEVNDETFTNVTAVEVLQLTGSSAVTLGDNAGANGLATVILGDGESTLSQSAGAFLIDGSAAASIIATVDSAELAASDTITGGAGIDTLAIANEGDVADETFANVTDVEVLQTAGASAVTLGDSAAANGLTMVVLGDGDSTVTQSAGAFAIDASVSSSVLLSVDSAELAASDTITGGAGIDSLSLVNEGDVADETFANITAVDVLVTAGASNVTLGDNASSNGLATVILGDGDSTVVQSGGVFEINASAASSVLVTVDTADLAAGDTITGGEGEDTLAIANEDSLSDEVFANKASLEILSLTGTSAVTLGDNAAGDIGLTTVLLGDGDSTIVQSAGSFLIDASATASVKVTVAGADLVAAETITGGEGVDTLELQTEGEVADETFANVTAVDVLVTSGSSNVTLGDIAGANGLATVILGDGDSTLTQTAGAFLVDAAAASSVLLTIDNAELATADTIVGGDGIDTLAITGEGEISDEVFANKTGLEVLQVAGASAVTLGDNAANSDLGLVTVVLGDGDSTLTQTAGAFAIDASATSSALVSIDSAELLAGNTITGGEGEDTLAIANEGEIGDEVFANITAVELLQLAGSTTATLGDNVAANGLTTVVLGDGDSTLTQTSGALVIDGTGATSALILVDGAERAAGDTITGGEGSDTLSLINSGDVADETFTNITAVDVLVTAGASNVTLGDNASSNGLANIVLGDGDSTVFQTGGAFTINAETASSVLVTVDNADLATADTITGSEGTDTLAISNEGDVADETFANITAVDVLVTAGASNVTLGDNASANGLTTVVLGDGDSTVTQTAGTFLIDGSASSSIAVTVNNADLATPNTIIGGSGTDTLTVLTGDISDDVFVDKSGFEVIAVGAGASITLGGNAGSEGVSSVYGSSGDSTITQTAENTSALYLDASASSNVAFVIDSAAIASNNTFVGGSGTDTLQLATEASAGDELFANATSIEVLVLNGASSIALGDNAAQLTKVIGGDGDTTLTQTAGSINLDLSASATSSITIDTGSIFTIDTVAGSAGVDTVTISNAATLGDAAFANKSSIELLQLTDNASVTLDGNAYASGTKTVIGGTGDLRIELGTEQARSLFIDGGAASSSYIKVASGAQAAGLESLVGSSSGNSTLSVGEGTIADTAFGQATGIAVLQLNGSSNLTMNTAANAITSMLTVVGGAGSSTINQGADQINALLLDGSAGSSNLFVIASAGQVSNDTIRGGSGTSTLGISTADNLEDGNLANVQGIDVLTLAGGTTADLGANLDLAGITTIVLGSGASSTISAAGSSANLLIDGSRGSLADVITAGAGNDTLLAGSSADTLTGGDGADLFVLGSGVGENAALITDFTVGTDILKLANYGSGASDYSLVGAESGPSQLFYSDTLVANISFSGSAADLLTNAQFV
jgi:Ca2+-binding RTX toxin-like protein